VGPRTSTFWVSSPSMGIIYLLLWHAHCVTVTRVKHSSSSYVEVLISLWLFLFPIFLLAAQPK
jgi:hypothetical protein